jgi:hypothetical protein
MEELCLRLREISYQRFIFTTMKHLKKTTLLTALFYTGFGSQHTFSHEHDESTPPPPPSRRTFVDEKELTKKLQELAPPTKRAPQQIQLPVLPKDVEELAFQDFYKMPVGARGLEPTERLLSLNGRRVRILGYMGEMERDNKRTLIFSPLPLQAQPEEYGLCDDIPATHILVTFPGNSDEQIRPINGKILLTGILSVGNYSENRETSFVRMQLDYPTKN